MYKSREVITTEFRISRFTNGFHYIEEIVIIQNGWLARSVCRTTLTRVRKLCDDETCNEIIDDFQTVFTGGYFLKTNDWKCSSFSRLFNSPNFSIVSAGMNSDSNCCSSCNSGRFCSLLGHTFFNICSILTTLWWSLTKAIILVLHSFNSFFVAFRGTPKFQLQLMFWSCIEDKDNHIILNFKETTKH